MVDVFTKQKRSEVMGRIKGENTEPERAVRSILHAMGLRFRLHRKDLPGKPDIVLPRWGVVVLVHGCFWHRHAGCRFCYEPKSRVEFWQAKFAGNVARDKMVRRALRRLGWRVIVVWECNLAKPERVRQRLARLIRS